MLIDDWPSHSSPPFGTDSSDWAPLNEAPPFDCPSVSFAYLAYLVCSISPFISICLCKRAISQFKLTILERFVRQTAVQCSGNLIGGVKSEKFKINGDRHTIGRSISPLDLLSISPFDLLSISSRSPRPTDQIENVTKTAKLIKPEVSFAQVKASAPRTTQLRHTESELRTLSPSLRSLL